MEPAAGSRRRLIPAPTRRFGRRRLVEEGLDAALSYKYSPASARPRIFDGAAEAKLIALACGEPPKGWARRKIVDRASDNTIGRTPK